MMLGAMELPDAPRFRRSGRMIATVLFAVSALSAAAPAAGQSDFPDHAVRLVLGFAAGGGNDTFARIVGQRLSELIKQPVVIENRPGAGGRLAAEYASRQTADGYTLMVGASGAMAIAPAIYADLPYRPTKDFIPLAMMASFPLIFAVAADNPATTVKDVVSFAKAHPDKSNYATTSPSFTIATELLKLKTGMPGVAIPYRSSSDMILSVISGQSMYAMADGPPVVPQVRAGKIKALAVTGSRRLAELPDVPSMAEAGYPAVDVKIWSGVFAPKGTPPDIVAKLKEALRVAIGDPGVMAKLRAMAVDPGSETPEQFQSRIDADIATYAAVVKAANLHFDD
jgi:tripartite-type tricarboxylate transporter receptor subunit TctC